MNQIKKYRRLKNLTQQELADKVGVHIQSVKSWEHGVNSITIKNLIKVSEILECSVNDILKGDE